MLVEEDSIVNKVNIHQKLALFHDHWNPRIVGDLSDLLAGCVAVRGLDSTTCEMKRLYVVPECRGQRLGRRLVEEAILRARSLGYARMLLDTLPEMAEAIRLYRTLGFVETDRYWDNPITRTIYLEKKLGTVGHEPDRAE